jgi:hypothetical protein
LVGNLGFDSLVCYIQWGHTCVQNWSKETTMSKKAKERQRDKRRKQKLARKRANYLRYGPKKDHVGKRQKKKAKNRFRPGKTKGPVSLSMSSAKTRAKRRRKFSSKKTGTAKFPLRPLRKRRRLGSVRTEDSHNMC